MKDHYKLAKKSKKTFFKILSKIFNLRILATYEYFMVQLIYNIINFWIF